MVKETIQSEALARDSPVGLTCLERFLVPKPNVKPADFHTFRTTLYFSSLISCLFLSSASILRLPEGLGLGSKPEQNIKHFH